MPVVVMMAADDNDTPGIVIRIGVIRIIAWIIIGIVGVNGRRADDDSPTVASMPSIAAVMPAITAMMPTASMPSVAVRQCGGQGPKAEEKNCAPQQKFAWIIHRKMGQVLPG